MELQTLDAAQISPPGALSPWEMGRQRALGAGKGIVQLTVEGKKHQ